MLKIKAMLLRYLLAESKSSQLPCQHACLAWPCKFIQCGEESTPLLDPSGGTYPSVEQKTRQVTIQVNLRFLWLGTRNAEDRPGVATRNAETSPGSATRNAETRPEATTRSAENRPGSATRNAEDRPGATTRNAETRVGAAIRNNLGARTSNP